VLYFNLYCYISFFVSARLDTVFDILNKKYQKSQNWHFVTLANFCLVLIIKHFILSTFIRISTYLSNTFDLDLLVYQAL
jgi:hypothetical protein